MKKVILLILSSFILFSCNRGETEELTTQQLEAEKQKVMEVVEEYNTAYQEESFTKIIETLSEKVVFFGTDSSEVIKSLNEFKKLIQEQWNHYEIKYGPIIDPLVIIDNRATVASVIFGVPGTVKQNNGPEEKVFFRIARTLEKQDKKWVIASGLIGITQTMPKVANAENAPVADSDKSKDAPKLQ